MPWRCLTSSQKGQKPSAKTAVVNTALQAGYRCSRRHRLLRQGLPHLFLGIYVLQAWRACSMMEPWQHLLPGSLFAAETGTSCSKIHALALLDIFPERTQAISQTAVVNTALQAGYRCSRRHRLLRQGLPHLFLGIYVLQAWRACSMMEPWQHLLPGSLFAAETGTSCSKIHALALLDIFPERTKAISQTAVVNTALQAGYRCSRRHRLLRQGLPHLFLGMYVLQAWRACSMMEPWQHLLPGSLFAAETGTSCSKIHAVALLDIFPERTKAISQTAVVNTALQAGYRCSRRHRLLRQGLPHLFLGIYVLQAWRACSMMEPWQHLLPGSLFAAETGTSCSKIHALALLDIFPERTKAISQTAVVNTALQAGYRCSRRHRLLRQGLPHLFLGIYVLQAWRACSMMEPWQHLLPGSLFAAETGTSCSKIHALALLDIFEERTSTSVTISQTAVVNTAFEAGSWHLREAVTSNRNGMLACSKALKLVARNAFAASWNSERILLCVSLQHASASSAQW